jgi:hypothetical protein
MAIEYFKKQNKDETNIHSYTAVGNEYNDPWGEKYRPTAYMEVEHTPKEWLIPFDNSDDVDPYLGLSNKYLTHMTEKALSKSDLKKTYDDMTLLDAVASSGAPEGSDEHDTLNYHLKTNAHLNPDKLFYEGKPSSIEIAYLMADPSMGTTAPTLGALAKRDLKAEEIVSSDSLSEYSSKLTKTAIAKGLPVKAHTDNPNASVTNNFDQHTMAVDANSPHWRMGKTQIPPETVAAARADLRGMLRATPKKRGVKAPAKKAVAKRNAQPVTDKGLSDQFIIPGMERFM